ncbi:MAG TPA: family 20 glycosylhydrolase [Candidatus Hydrogenedentes bacterium]|nr:family 20 glycosylhydrolase [Candidatus Hydrogenedentota bacterium]HPG66538.1 family 20 glycosylhydrolase [Candidatus Hydrogenedentota bacterium]
MKTMRWTLPVVVVAGMMVAGCATTRGGALRGDEAWRGVHVYVSNRAELPMLHRALREVFAPAGVNVLVLEVDYAFQFASHPELASSKGLTKEDAHALAALCRELGIRLIPEFNCFGHQGSRPNILLSKYPELMVPKAPDYESPSHYHVSWNPLDPKTNEIVFALIGELIDAFEVDAFHVGLDEVMYFPDESTSYYHGESHAEVFAKVVNDLHGFVVDEKGLTMLMWGDRLLDSKVMRYGSYEASAVDTASAIDAIPKDIVICDWHYMRRKDYPSLTHFQDHGFRVWPTSWRSASAGLALWNCAHGKASTERMLGHLTSSWCGLEPFCYAVLREKLDNINHNAVRAGETFHAIAAVWND